MFCKDNAYSLTHLRGETATRKRAVTGLLEQKETQDPSRSEEEINDGAQLSNSQSFFVNHNLSKMPGIRSGTDQALCSSLLTPGQPYLDSEQRAAQNMQVTATRTQRHSCFWAHRLPPCSGWGRGCTTTVRVPQKRFKHRLSFVSTLRFYNFF